MGDRGGAEARIARIPRVELSAERGGLADEVQAAIGRVLASGHYILGPEVEAFEEEFAAYCGVRHCVATGSGTDAISLALRAAGVGPGAEVVTVAYTAVATAFAVELAGATPVFVEIDPARYTMDPASAADAIRPATRALLPVHLYGQCADMEPLRELADEHGLLLVEDACQAHGATYRGRRAGALADVGCFSFYPTKNLGAYGDGGAIVTDDGELADRVRLLRAHGLMDGYVHVEPAGNSRLDELQAAILRAKLPHLDSWNDSRRRLADLYADGLRDAPVEVPIPAGWGEHAYHLYVIRAPRRDALRRHLLHNGVETAVHYPVPVHRQPPYASAPASLPVTEAYVSEILSLPMYPQLEPDQVERVTALVREFYEADG